MKFDSKTTHKLLVLQQKVHDTEFCVPIQGVYETMVPESSTARYNMVVDGEYYSGNRLSKVLRGNDSNVSALSRPTNLNDFKAKSMIRNLVGRGLRRLKNMV